MTKPANPYVRAAAARTALADRVSTLPPPAQPVALRAADQLQAALNAYQAIAQSGRAPTVVEAAPVERAIAAFGRTLQWIAQHYGAQHPAISALRAWAASLGPAPSAHPAPAPLAAAPAGAVPVVRPGSTLFGAGGFGGRGAAMLGAPLRQPR
jgi:hypothetical protein